jgi:hypothetical protein
MIQRLPIFTHIWILARVYPFGSVWLGDYLYSELTSHPFEPLTMLPIKLFCVATIAFPFLVLSGSARLLLRNPSKENKSGLIIAASLLVSVFASLQIAILYTRVTGSGEDTFWTPLLVFSPVYTLALIPIGIFCGRYLSMRNSEIQEETEGSLTITSGLE